MLVSLAFICICCKWRPLWIKNNIISVLKNTSTDLRMPWNLCPLLWFDSLVLSSKFTLILNPPAKIFYHDLDSEPQGGNFQRKLSLVSVKVKTWMIWLQFWEVLFEIWCSTFQLQANFLIFIQPLAEFCYSERWGAVDSHWVVIILLSLLSFKMTFTYCPSFYFTSLLQWMFHVSWVSEGRGWQLSHLSA